MILNHLFWSKSLCICVAICLSWKNQDVIMTTVWIIGTEIITYLKGTYMTRVITFSEASTVFPFPFPFPFIAWPILEYVACTCMSMQAGINLYNTDMHVEKYLFPTFSLAVHAACIDIEVERKVSRLKHFGWWRADLKTISGNTYNLLTANSLILEPEN